MTIGIFRSMVLARAIAVEPIARALCADHIDADTPSVRAEERPLAGGRAPCRAVDLDDGRSRDRGRTGRRGFALNFNSSSCDEAFTSIHKETST